MTMCAGRTPRDQKFCNLRRALTKPEQTWPAGSETCWKGRKRGERKLHASRSDQNPKQSEARLRRLYQNRRSLGPFEDVPRMRSRGLLRFIQEQARYKALSWHLASADALD